MRIGIICYPTFGGSGVVATELGLALARKGHEVHFIAYSQPVRLQHYEPRVFYHEVIVPKYPLFDYLPYESALAGRIVNVARHGGLDLIHVHYAIPHASAGYLAAQILKEKGVRLPLITTLHGTDITLVGKDKTYAPVVEFSINRSDGVTAVSSSLKQDTLKHFQITRDIEVIPNFIDLARFTKTNKEHFRKAIAPGGEKILIHVSNFRKVKRTEDVIRMYYEIRKRMPVRLLLVGDGPERQSAEQLCREMGNCEDVRFLGKQEPVEELLAIADLFLLPSESESFGLSALEAMACRVPVISSDTGGLPEINLHGKTGFLSSVGDVKDMAEKALYLLSDNVKLEAFRQNAYEQAKKYDLNKILPLYEQYYERVINQMTNDY